jgi:hypothetical protein
MKKLVVLFAIMAVVLALSACGGAVANDPTSVSKAFLEKLKTFDFDGAKQLATADGQKVLGMLQGFMAMADKAELEKQKAESAKGELKIISVDEQGDKATVKYSMKEGETSSMDLVKENGQWKVNFKKEL